MASIGYGANLGTRGAWTVALLQTPGRIVAIRDALGNLRSAANLSLHDSVEGNTALSVFSHNFVGVMKRSVRYKKDRLTDCLRCRKFSEASAQEEDHDELWQRFPGMCSAIQRDSLTQICRSSRGWLGSRGDPCAVSDSMLARGLRCDRMT